MTDTNTEIARLEKEIQILKEKRKRFEEQPIEVQIATRLHEILCKWNHTDGCSWFYCEHDWTDDTHKMYLSKAMTLLDFSKFYNIKPEYLVDLIASVK